MSFASFRTNLHRHGLRRAALRTALNTARRVIDFEICQVEADTGAPFTWPDVVGFETHMVDSDEFHRSLCAELARADYRWAFARGDSCVASFHGSELIGYTFYSRLPTRGREGVEFVYPPSYVYGFASATAPSYRGKRLEQARWKTARRHRNAMGSDPRIIWYINVANLESRRAFEAVEMPKVLLGYVAYVHLAGDFRFFASRGARRVGASFRALFQHRAN